jgi:hypothetical protein
MKVVRLDDGLINQYELFLKNNNALIYSSNKYRVLLKSFLQQDDYYFIAIDDHNNILGVLPTFICKNTIHGNVINSLPFYGSNGGILEFDHDINVRNELLRAYDDLAMSTSCVASTIITSPLQDMSDYYEGNYVYDFRDKRIGQISTFGGDSGKEDLMSLFHSKTRNMIRKAMKLDIEVKIDNSHESFTRFFDIHKDNMAKIGGLSKSYDFFSQVRCHFKADRDYKLYTALLDGKIIAALLLFYYNKTVEYFTPAISSAYRHMQPLSLLIFNAMQDAVDEGYSCWNWGGTWITQPELYRFKKRWNTDDYYYYYYNKIYDDAILSLTRQDLLKEYPYFYVCPYGQLQPESPYER